MAEVKAARAELAQRADASSEFATGRARRILSWSTIGARHGEFVQAMRARGVLVRDRSSDPGCDGLVRITIGTREQMRQARERDD